MAMREGTISFSWESAVKELRLRIKVKVKVSFAQDKYHIRLDYDLDEATRCNSRIIIYDGSSIFANSIAKGIHPKGSEVDIYDASKDRASPARAFFDFDPRNLSSKLTNVDFACGKFPNLRLEKRGGNYVGVLTIPKAFVRFTVLPEYGYNVASSEVLGDLKSPPSQEGAFPSSVRTCIHSSHYAAWTCGSGGLMSLPAFN